MSFENAPVSKGLMVGCALTSIFVGVFDVKHYANLQLVPHISRHHQYWRLFTHHLAFESSSDLFVAEVLLYSTAVQIERQFGSTKFASYAVVSTLLSTILEFTCLLLFNRVGVNNIPAGPLALLFSILYNYSRIVPSAYQFRIFGVPFTNKIFQYALAAQITFSHLPGSAVVVAIGILAGQIYRSDMTNLKSYRLPASFVNFASQNLLPLIGSTRPPRRTNRALPDSLSVGNENANTEVITTAREPQPVPAPVEDAPPSVMREWVDELTGRAERGVRIPSDAEITQLTSMFPNVARDVVVGALQRSPGIEGAVETLLSSGA
ncbi:hypothetical protein PLICRDRAFT_33452 [Plicaturopsis crispa FD-325 SS-3]|nr:hypothetical protein PLICRDRAFT_33452 [Plicaturopsis crispa FD-325 SS-3]